MAPRSAFLLKKKNPKTSPIITKTAKKTALEAELGKTGAGPTK